MISTDLFRFVRVLFILDTEIACRNINYSKHIYGEVFKVAYVSECMLITFDISGASAEEHIHTLISSNFQIYTKMCGHNERDSPVDMRDDDGDGRSRSSSIANSC